MVIGHDITTATTKKWVKPFSTGLSCPDTVDGECLEGMSVNECYEYCRAHPLCNEGYHIEFGEERYCVPLNGLLHFGMQKVFEQSMFDAEDSRFFHPGVGVRMSVFDQLKIPSSRDSFGGGFIQNPFLEPTTIQHIPSGRFLEVDSHDNVPVTTSIRDGDDDDKPKNRGLWQVHRQIFDFSGVHSAVFDRISNGEIVSIRSLDDNKVLSYHDKDPLRGFELVPLSVYAGASSSFRYENVVFFQLFQKQAGVLNPDEPFAFRINTIPVVPGKTPVYFLEVDPASGALIAVRADDHTRDIERHRVWRLRVATPETTERKRARQRLRRAFIDSQYLYANEYLGAKSYNDFNHDDDMHHPPPPQAFIMMTTTPGILFVALGWIMAGVLVGGLMYWIFLQRRRWRRRRRQEQ